MKKWYAVQSGDNYDWDWGSAVKREAVKLANSLKRDPDHDGEEIRIAVIVNDSCEDEIIVREGTR